MGRTMSNESRRLAVRAHPRRDLATEPNLLQLGWLGDDGAFHAFRDCADDAALVDYLARNATILGIYTLIDQR